MKRINRFWLVIAVICLVVLIITLVTQFYNYLIGKIVLAFSVGFLSSALMKVYRKESD